MNISEHLKKDYWLRRIKPDSNLVKTSRYGSGIYKPIGSGDAVYIKMTQEDFLDEIAPTAHEINSKYMSQRAIWGPTGNKDKNGNEEWKITGYDELESIALGLQECVAIKKTTHFAGDGFWMAREDGDESRFSKLMSYFDRIGVKTGFIDLVNSCFNTGDGAIYLYQRGQKKIEYQVFSFLYGDQLFPDTDDEGNPVLYRKYILKGKQAVDIFSTKYRETWVLMDPDEEKNKNWLDKLRGTLNIGRKEKSEDGYVLVSRKEAQTGDDLQVIYFRVPDIPSGPGELSAEGLENALSYVANEAKDSAFPILFLKSEKVINLPPSKMNAKTIGVKGTADTVKNSDAKFLTPPDASNINDIHINSLWDNFCRSTMSVFVEPEILKSGADSSTTIKIMFTPEIQWCMREWIYFQKGVQQIADVLKTLVGKVEGEVSAYGDLVVSVGQNIWIPQNEKEAMDIATSAVYARIKSRKAAITDTGNSHIDDYEVINREWEDELDMKARIPAKYNQSASNEPDDNPDAPKIDNNDPGKSIADR